MKIHSLITETAFIHTHTMAITIQHLIQRSGLEVVTKYVDFEPLTQESPKRKIEYCTGKLVQSN